MIGMPRFGDDARSVYDATATEYTAFVGTELSEATEGPVDRFLLRAFAELVDGNRGPVGDLGCGAGRVAAFLGGSNVDVVGIDVSVELLRHGRIAHPNIGFAAG